MTQPLSGQPKLLVTIHPRVLRHNVPVYQAASVTIQNLYRDTAFPQAIPASPVMIHLVYCDTTYQPTSHCLSRYTQLYRDLHPSQTARLRLLCHDTIPHCIVTQLGSSPTIYAPFFFHTFFSATRNTQKYVYPNFFFHSPVHPNKFIKIYFSHFSSVLPTVKPKKKKNSHHTFFFISSSLLATPYMQ